MNTRSSAGFTLVELLVVIAIIGILIAMMLPAIQSAREAARRNACAGHLAQLGVALSNYESAHEQLPAGVVDPKGPIRNVAESRHMGWLVQLLPYIEEKVVFGNIDQKVSVYDKKNAQARAVSVALFFCPSCSDGWVLGTDNEPWDFEAFPGDEADPESGSDVAADVRAVSTYAGCHHDVEAPIDANNHGVLFLNSRVRLDEVTDGLTHTIFVGEKVGDPADLGWMSGTRASLRNTGSPMTLASRLDSSQGTGPAATPPSPLFVGGFSSEHAAVSNFLFGDGTVRTLSQDINAKIYQQLGHRADGKLLQAGPTRGEP